MLSLYSLVYKWDTDQVVQEYLINYNLKSKEKIYEAFEVNLMFEILTN